MYYTNKCSVQFFIWPANNSNNSSWTSVSFLVYGVQAQLSVHTDWISCLYVFALIPSSILRNKFQIGNKSFLFAKFSSSDETFKKKSSTFHSIFWKSLHHSYIIATFTWLSVHTCWWIKPVSKPDSFTWMTWSPKCAIACSSCLLVYLQWSIHTQGPESHDGFYATETYVMHFLEAARFQFIRV